MSVLSVFFLFLMLKLNVELVLDSINTITFLLFYRRFNDVWVLDMTQMTWSCPNIRGKKPSGRFGHSQVLF